LLRALALLFIAIPATAPVQAYPIKPVRVVSPYPPSASADIIGRDDGGIQGKIEREYAELAKRAQMYNIRTLCTAVRRKFVRQQA
jgi:hypothetical protein